MRRHVLSVALVLLSLASTPASAAALAPSKPSQIVTLFQSGAACPTLGFVIGRLAMSDGTLASFVIPPKQVLVVTGFEWHAENGAAGSGVSAILSTQASGTPAIDYATSTTTFDSNGVAVKNDVTPLIVIKPGRTICISVTSGDFSSGFVHGFLAPDK
jgi:hypothetical protein